MKKNRTIVIAMALVFAAVLLVFSIVETVGDSSKHPDLLSDPVPDQWSIHGEAARERNPITEGGNPIFVEPYHAAERFEEVGARIHELVAKEGSLALKLKELAPLCEELCEIGGIERSLAFVLNEAGPGRIREWMIAAIVGASEGTIGDTIFQIRSLPEGGAVEAGLTGLAMKLQGMDLEPSLFEGIKFSDAEMDALALGVACRVGIVGASGQAFDVAMGIECLRRASRDGELLEKNISEYLTHAAIRDSSAALQASLEWISDCGMEDAASFDSLIEVSVTSGPKAALEVLTTASSIGDDSALSRLVEVGFRKWLGLDSSAALNWAETSTNRLEATVKHSIQSTVVKHEIGRGDLSEARRIVAEVNDVDLQAKMEGWIWQAERKTLQREMSAVPRETLDSIVSGSSVFGNYWLEEAIHTWVSKDFDSANAWYEENWNSLPKEKAQYVAAGFATQAIGQGDVETARQWAEMIQDTKTRERIEGAIAKAAGD